MIYLQVIDHWGFSWSSSNTGGLDNALATNPRNAGWNCGQVLILPCLMISEEDPEIKTIQDELEINHSTIALEEVKEDLFGPSLWTGKPG